MSVPWSEIAPLNDDDEDFGEVEVIHLSDYAKVKENQTVQIEHEKVGPRTLLEACARFIGQNLPFELVQLHPQRVPEEVQKRIAYWSFPLEEKRLFEIAKTMHGISEDTVSRVIEFVNGLGVRKRKAFGHWNELEDHYDSYEDLDYSSQHIRTTKTETSSQDLLKMTQIGMHLFGTVENSEIMHGVYHHSGYHDTNSPISLCIQFDRGRITSTTCSCCSSSKWCEHVILLCIARIRGIVPCEIHPPMSEILRHFNGDQLQKLIHLFLENVHPVEIPPMMALACQLKDKEPEITKQRGASDPTAGGSTGEVPRWEINEQFVINCLEKELQNLKFSNDRITDIHEFKQFEAFLQDHDENITTAFKWFLETINMLRNKLENSHCEEDRYGHLHYSSGSYPWKRSNLVCLVLMQGLQIFFVDPLISRHCKEEIADKLKGQDAFTLTEPLTNYYTSLLQEAVLVHKENPRPTLHYLITLQSALQGAISSVVSDCREGPNDRSRILLDSLVAVLRYWLFHKHSCNLLTSSAVVLEICSSIFPAIPSAKSTFEDLIILNECLEGIQVSSLLRHGQVLMEYLIHSGVDQQEIVIFAAKLLRASSVGMSAIVQTASKDKFFFVTQLEEAILCLAQQHISCERESFTLVLRQIVKEYLHRDVGEGVFIWPWSLLRLAALDPLMVEDVREVTQNLIGNANSILHCTSQTDEVYPPHVVDLVRDSLLSLLQHLFNTLQPDSAQVLFTTLSDAFPFPVTYSDERSLPDELQDFQNDIDYEIQELQELKKRLKVGVLPNLQCDPSLLHLVQHNGRFIVANEAIQSVLLKAVNAKYSIDTKHVTFIQKLSMLQNHRNHSQSFQLQLLCLRVWKSRSGYYGRGKVLTSDQKLPLGTSSGQTAFLYLVDNWQYCLSPYEVLNFIASRLCTNFELNGCEDQVAQLISTVLLADKDAVKSMRCSIESLVNILAASEDPEHLLNFVDVLDAKSGVEELQHVGEALGRLYSRIKGRAEEATCDDDHLVRLKIKFMTTLERIVTRITEENRRVLYGYHNRRVHVKVREWAPLLCAIGGDAIKKFLTVLQHSHRVDSLEEFPYGFCKDLGILWTEYSTSLLSSNPSILSVPAFEKITTQLLSENEENVYNTINKYRNNTKRVKEAMLFLASIYQPLQLEKEFKIFAFEMSTMCSENVKRMVVRRFVNTPLSAIKIPTAMLDHAILPRGKAKERLSGAR